MDFFSQFILVIVAHFLGVASPGPDFAVVVRNSVSLGRKKALFTALGIALGVLIHSTYCILGIAVVITSSKIIFNFIKIAGALYLIYIGIMSIKAKKNSKDKIEINNKVKKREAFRNGLFVNLLNPKATLFFLVVFSQILTIDTKFEYKIVYGLYMGIATLFWFSFIAYVFSIEVVRKKFYSYSYIIERIIGTAFILFALKLLF